MDSQGLSEENMLIGEALHTDNFGNIITNFREKELDSMNIKSTLGIKLGTRKLRLRLCEAYGDVHEKEALAVVGSHSFLEISVNQGNAATAFRVRIGDKIALFQPRQ